MKRFLALLACMIAFGFGAEPAKAQLCNSPSGFLQSFGPITVGHILILGPDCVHAQDGGTFGAGVNSVSNSDGTLTISPTTGSVVASIALGHANAWSGVQTFNSGNFRLAGLTSGNLTINCAAICGANSLTLPAGTTDFSGTGGASEVVKQTTLGGALTVAQLAFTDISGTASLAQLPALAFSNITGQAALSQLPTMGAFTVLTNKTNGNATPTAIQTLWLGGQPGEANANDLMLIAGTLTGLSDNNGALKLAPSFNNTNTYIAGIFIEPSFLTSNNGTTYSGIHINDAFTQAGYAQVNQVGITINKPTKASTINLPLFISGNACCQTNVIPSVATGLGKPYLYILPLDSEAPLFMMDGYGTFSNASVVARFARGTQAAPTPVQANDQIFQFTGMGIDTNGGSFSNPAVAFALNAGANNWSNTNHSTSLRFQTTPENSTTVAESARITPGIVGSGSCFDLGVTTECPTNGASSVQAKGYLQSGVTTVANLPACGAGTEGARYYVSDQATAVAYRGAVTGSGATRQAVLCSNGAWIQD